MVEGVVGLKPECEPNDRSTSFLVSQAESTMREPYVCDSSTYVSK